MAGKGRKKTETKMIEKKAARIVCFSKRRQGLFKKTRELSVLTGARVGVLVFSPAGKPMTPDAPTLEALVDQHMHASSSSSLIASPPEVRNWEELFSEAMDGKLTERPWWYGADAQRMGLKEVQRFELAVLAYKEKWLTSSSSSSSSMALPAMAPPAEAPENDRETPDLIHRSELPSTTEAFEPLTWYELYEQERWLDELILNDFDLFDTI